LLRKKMIFNFHGLFIENLYNTEMEKFIYRQIHKIISYFNSVELAIVPSNSSKKILIDETGLFKTIKVYYNGYDGEIADKTDQEIVDYFLELKKTFFLIGIIGRIDIQKRIDIAFEIARKIIKYRNDICFVFVGNGDLDKEMAQKLERMNLGNNAKMLGYVPNAKLYIKYFNLVLFTSDWEGFPLSIWESMAAGVPIVSTDVGGVREILEKEDCGIIYPRRNVDAGVEAILLLLNDNEKLKKMGERGAYAIQSKYNSKSFADFFNNLYSSLAAPDS
jgi:glycosyltransferase involved in cell wall biosynthesis